MTARVEAPWLSAPETAAVLDALEAVGGAGCVKFVGGCVRDALVGRAGSDVDLATLLRPEQVVEALGAAGLKAVPTGIDHGTVTAVSGGRPHEVTTLRRDVSTDGRRAVVAFTDDWREDAARRDFRLNALYADRTGEVFDPTGAGVEDALAGRVIFVGEPAARILEDHLRILRFYRFHAWYGRGAPDAEGQAACAAGAEGVARLSVERVSHELMRLLAAPDPVPALLAMHEAGVLSRVLPTASDPIGLKALVPLSADPLLRLSALLPGDPIVAGAEARRLRLPKGAWSRLEAAAPPLDPAGMDARSARALVHAEGGQAAQDRALKALAADPGLADEAGVVLEVARTWTPPRLPVGGQDVARLGVAAGPETGAVLKAFEREWVEADFPEEDPEPRLRRIIAERRVPAR